MSLTFGPQWLRSLSDSGSSSGAGGQYKLAEHRYGREELLALYKMTSSVCPDLEDTSVMLPKPVPPLALVPMSEEEQALLIQNVNSGHVLKSYGRGLPSNRGGRGDSDRGRGRGRGRDDDIMGRRPREPWEEGYGRGGGSFDAANRGKSYDRGVGGYQNSVSHVHDSNGPGGYTRELSRSMSNDNWREAKSSLPDDDHRGGGAGSRGWTSSRNWRDSRDTDGHGNDTDRRANDYDNSRYRRNLDESGGRRIEYRRPRIESSLMDDDTTQDVLPEWSTVDAEEIETGGSFDATGAFLSSKDNMGAKKASSDVDVDVNNQNPSTTSRVSNVDRLVGSDTETRRPFTNSLASTLHSNRSTAHSSESDSERRTADRSAALTDSIRQNGLEPSVNVASRSVVHSSDPVSIPSQNNTNDSLPVPIATQATALNNLSAKEVENCVVQWTGDSSQLVVGRAAASTHSDTVGAAAGVSTTDDGWYYYDPQGQMQGPFKNSEMAEWFTAGYFNVMLQVRRGSTGPFTTLGDLITAHHGLPFIDAPMPSVPVSAGSSTDAGSLPATYTDAQRQQLLQQQHLAVQHQLLLRNQLQMMQAQQQIANTGGLPSSVNGITSLGNTLPLGFPMQLGHLVQQNMSLPGLASSVSSMPSSAGESGVPAMESHVWDIPAENLHIAAREKEEQDRIAAEQERVVREREQAERLRIAQEQQQRAQEQQRAREIELEKTELQRLQEERRQQEEERQRLAEERRKLEELRRQQEREQKRLEEERQAQELMRRKKEEEARQQQEQLEWQHQQELVKRLEEDKRRAAEERRLAEQRDKEQTDTMIAKQAPAVNLAQIQQAEELLQKQLAAEEAERRALMDAQMAELDAIQRRKQQAASWKERPALPPVLTTPSLLEIQLEQEKQLAEERSEQEQQAKVAAVNMPFSSAAVWGNTSAIHHPPSSVWETVDSNKKSRPSATNNSQFPALPSNPKSKSSAQAAGVRPPAKTTKSQKEEAVVQKLFESAKQKDELTTWCQTVLQGIETSIDLPTLVEMLKDIESPYEVHDYIRNYLGESKQVQTFAQQFLEKRSKLRNAAKPKHEEDGLWGPAPALNPLLARQQAAARQQQQQLKHGQQSNKSATHTASRSSAAGSADVSASDAGGGSKKKKRMQKLDSSVLGFTVIADPQRTNAGELEKI